MIAKNRQNDIKDNQSLAQSNLNNVFLSNYILNTHSHIKFAYATAVCSTLVTCLIAGILIGVLVTGTSFPPVVVILMLIAFLASTLVCFSSYSEISKQRNYLNSTLTYQASITIAG
jgi:ribose/xylose/arabinose/galactoside ABC-type transport system permease subunit